MNLPYIFILLLNVPRLKCTDPENILKLFYIPQTVLHEAHETVRSKQFLLNREMNTITYQARGNYSSGLGGEGDLVVHMY